MPRKFWRIAAYVLLAAHFGMIGFIWWNTLREQPITSTADALVAWGRLFGLLAAGCVLLQFMLMGRAAWIERAFGLERIAKLHRLNGYAVGILILLHPLTLTLGYAGFSGRDLITQYLTFLTKFQDVLKAFLAELLFLTVIAASIYIVRKHLRYEWWYWVHLMVYLAIILVFGHQVAVGGSFLLHPGITAYWYGLYAFVGLNVFYGRFFLPFFRYLRHRFTVDEVVAETPDTVSIYIRGRQLDHWSARPGQFVIIWLPTKKFWYEEHPFSISGLPKDGRLRITVKNVGDFTAKLQHLKTGLPVVVSGPYGSFSPDLASPRKRLYIAGGVGITPLRAMMEAEAPGAGSVLVYGNKTSADIIFRSELESKDVTVHHVFSDEPTASEHGYIDAARIERLVPDFRERDVYLCGPPIMMHKLTADLTKAGLPAGRLHSERFALHPVS